MLSRLLLASALCLPLGGCSANWGWYVVSPATEQGRSNLWFLLGGLTTTLAISLTAIVIGMVLGFLVALPGLSASRGWRRFNRIYVEGVRAIPVLVLILWVYYGLPIVTGLKVEAFWAGVLALALSDSAFEAEIFRAGIQSVEKGQREAAKALGLNGWQRMRLVILPQALRRILPALGNQFVYMLKMSSLVSVIGMSELTRRANELVTAEYRPLEVYTILVAEYLVLILIVSYAVRRLERRMAISETR
jgi:polar amino acid transport system permease protein